MNVASPFRVVLIAAVCSCGSLSDRVARADEPAAAANLLTHEDKIRNALAGVATLEFIETPLSDVVEFLRDSQGLPIQISHKALNDAGVSADVPITQNLKGVPLRTALRVMLRDLDLTYRIDGDVLVITTREDARQNPSTRVYDVADLLPVSAADAEELAALVRQMLPDSAPRPHDPSRPPGARQPGQPAVAAYHFLLVARGAEEDLLQVEQLLARLERSLNQAAQSEAQRRGAIRAPLSSPALQEDDPFGDGDPFSVPARNRP